MAGFDTLTSTLARLTPVQKIALGAAALTVVAGTVVLTRSDSAKPMAPVFSDLEARDAASVTDELTSRGVDYELADGGRTVMVPRDDVYDLRIALSGQGLPSSSEGYALLDRQGLTTSDFRQRIDYQRALEGELARTLRAIDGVESATVHLALPEDSVFVDEPARPTASVLVRSSGLSEITSGQVAAMVHLVASSVKNMAPEDVTIADASGTVLAAGGETGGVAASGGSRADATTAFERDLAGSIRSLVASVTGHGNVAVTVQADLDLTERQETSERFDSSDADNGVVVAERTTTETYSGSEAAAETGVLGPDGATVAAPVTVPAEGNTYLRDDAERTYAVNRTVESVVEAPGKVNRVSVAVLVNESAVTDAQLASIEEMVATAAGVDVARGDQVTVARLPFDTSAGEAALVAADAEAAAQAKADQMSLIRTGVIGFVVLVAMLLAYRSARRARREVATPIDIGAIRAAPAHAALPVESEAPEPAAIPAAVAVNPVTEASRAALDELSVLADRRPEEVAQILHSWLADERAST